MLIRPLGLKETPRPVPLSISEPVLPGGDALPAGAAAQAEKKG